MGAVSALLAIALFGAVAAGTYLLRNEQTPSIIVAPTSPASVTSPSPSASAAPPVSPLPPAAVSWERAGGIPLTGEAFGNEAATIRDVVSIESRYIGVGTAPTTWVSEDGSTWASVDLPFEASTGSFGLELDASVMAVASTGSQVVVVGGYGREPCDRPTPDTGRGYWCPRSPISWMSDDGQTWRSSHPWQGPKRSTGYVSSQFTEVWAVPTGGWDAVLGYWEGEALTGTEIWHSDDGMTWVALDPVPAGLVGMNQTAHGIADPAGRRLIWGARWLHDERGDLTGVETRLAVSPDGRGWQAIDGFLANGALVRTVVAPRPGRADPWILAGSTSLDLGQTNAPTVWVSSDLEAWTTIMLPVTDVPPELCAALERTSPCSVISGVDALALTDDGYLAVGAFIDDSRSNHRSTTWQSRDGWSWVESGWNEFGIPILADGPADLIGIGLQDQEDDALAVWRLKFSLIDSP